MSSATAIQTTAIVAGAPVRVSLASQAWTGVVAGAGDHVGLPTAAVIVTDAGDSRRQVGDCSRVQQGCLTPVQNTAEYLRCQARALHLAADRHDDDLAAAVTTHMLQHGIERAQITHLLISASSDAPDDEPTGRGRLRSAVTSGHTADAERMAKELEERAPAAAGVVYALLAIAETISAASDSHTEALDAAAWTIAGRICPPGDSVADVLERAAGALDLAAITIAERICPAGDSVAGVLGRAADAAADRGERQRWPRRPSRRKAA